MSKESWLRSARKGCLSLPQSRLIDNSSTNQVPSTLEQIPVSVKMTPLMHGRARSTRAGAGAVTLYRCVPRRPGGGDQQRHDIGASSVGLQPDGMGQSREGVSGMVGMQGAAPARARQKLRRDEPA